MPMKHPPHPGLSIRHDCLEPLGLSVSEAAWKLDVSQEQLSDILNGYRGISLDMAVRLDKVFGGGVTAWQRMQLAYDRSQAIRNSNEIGRRLVLNNLLVEIKSVYDISIPLSL